MEMLGSEINIMSILSKSAILLVLVVLILLSLPFYLFILTIIYFIFSFYISIVIALFYKKERRDEVVMKIMTYLGIINNKKAYSRARRIGSIIAAIQLDWLPKLIGGKRIAKILLDHCADRYVLFITAFLKGMESQTNMGKNKDTINFIESLEKERKSNETEDDQIPEDTN